jgi:hypothetical protein
LSDLFDRLGSDKGTAGDGHGYAGFYAENIPRSTKKLVEVGIGTFLNFNGSCGSILAWLEWIDGEVVGFDIHDPTVEIASPRFTFVKGDLGCQADLERLAAASVGADVIIDDGSHLSDHVWRAFDNLYPSVKSGGMYIIEDVHIRDGAHPSPAEVFPNHPDFECWIGRGGDRGIVLRKP